MNKQLISVLIVGFLTANPLYVQASKSEHAHGKEETHGHGHDDHSQHNDEHNHDEHKSKHDEHVDHKDHKHDKHNDKEHHSDHQGHDHGSDQHKHGEDNDKGHQSDHKGHGGHEHHGEHEKHDDHDKKKGHETHGNKEPDHHEGEHGIATSVALKPAQVALADIQLETLTPVRVDYELYAPGELLPNSYTSYQVSPRIPSVVLKRHVALGDHVKAGQALVTLFSENMAQAQAEYRKTLPDWQRVQNLGRKTVGEQRYISAKASFETAQATLLAYGLSRSDLKTLAKRDGQSLGEYTLRAKIDGTVLSDHFEQGQRIESGGELIVLADEKQLWVEAHLSADLTLTLGTGAVAEVVVGRVRTTATVSQEAHTIDPVTRTRTVRLLIDNPEHRLHQGQFAEVYFQFRTEEPVLAVPETALMRGADGDWTLFMEDHPGEFQTVEVELGRALGTLREINGVPPGKKIVTEGAFFVASQIAKGGFDPHNH